LQEAAVEQEAERQALETRKTTLADGREKLAALRARQESIATDRHVRKTAAEAQEKSRQHAARATVLSKGIEALQRYRLQLAEKLPIKGLAVKFDEKGRKSLTLDGVPLSQVNDGRLVELATEVSLLRARRPDDGTPFLPIVLLDGLERLNAKKRAALLREIASRGSQVVAAVVAEDTFKALRGDDALEPQAGA
jgi:hypothetical protein